MAIRMGSLCSLSAVSLIVLFSLPAISATTKTCPAGLFCTSGGKYTFDKKDHDIQAYQMQPAELVVDGWGMHSDEGICDSCGQKKEVPCVYCANEYDEMWASLFFGYYFVKNGEVTYHSNRSSMFQGVFTCPGTYPSSAEGASSVFECYRIVSDGQKDYYKAPTNTQTSSGVDIDIKTVNALVKDLQAALSKAQSLQSALNKFVSLEKLDKLQLQTPVFGTSSIEKAKAMISAGVSVESNVNQNNNTTTNTGVVSSGKPVLKTNKGISAKGLMRAK